MASIVFENIDVLLDCGLPIDLERVQQKLVHRGRGGYCHEHNLLFAAVLERCGFRVRRLLARARDNGIVVLPRGHATLLVEVDGATWLADVGFGCDGLLEPLPLAEGPSIHQGAWSYRLERRGPDWVLRGGAADATVLYSFVEDGDYRQPDFDAVNYFVSTHPSSPFATELIVQRVTPQARYALRGLTLVITIPNGRRAQRRIAARDLGAVLRDTFGIDVPETDAGRLAAVAARPVGPAAL